MSQQLNALSLNLSTKRPDVSGFDSRPHVIFNIGRYPISAIRLLHVSMQMRLYFPRWGSALSTRLSVRAEALVVEPSQKHKTLAFSARIKVSAAKGIVSTELPHS